MSYSSTRFIGCHRWRARWINLSTLVQMCTLITAPLGLQGQSKPQLSEAQSQIVNQVSDALLAPCCWRESLTVHRSQTAVDLRVEVEAMARAGMTAEQITGRMVERFGVRILREPPGSSGRWLYVLPIVACLGGFVLLTRFIRRNLQTEEPPQ